MSATNCKIASMDYKNSNRPNTTDIKRIETYMIMSIKVEGIAAKFLTAKFPVVTEIILLNIVGLFFLTFFCDTLHTQHRSISSSSRPPTAGITAPCC